MINDSSNLLFDKEQHLVWQCEIAYWQALKTANANNLLTLLHSKLEIWPDWSEHAINKIGFEQHLKKNLQPYDALIELKAESIVAIDSTAIVYYLAMHGDGRKRKTDKITHIWMFEKDHYLMIGGTSSRLNDIHNE